MQIQRERARAQQRCAAGDGVWGETAGKGGGEPPAARGLSAQHSAAQHSAAQASSSEEATPSLPACSRAHTALQAVRAACEARGLRAPVSAAARRAMEADRRGAGRGGEGRHAEDAPSWGLREVRGRVVELYAQAGSASLTAAMSVVWEAQSSGEPAVWVSATSTFFYPDDARSFGIDLQALAVIRAPHVFSALRSSERLLRSGAFGVVVLDLGANPRVPNALVGKLVKLSQRHSSAVLCLTSGSRSGSLGSLVSLRVTTRRTRVKGGVFRCDIHTEKDKRRGPGWQGTGEYCGPLGLR